MVPLKNLACKGLTRDYMSPMESQQSCANSSTHDVIVDMSLSVQYYNTLRPRQNGRHFADDTFNRIFINENVRISIKVSLKFVPKGPINNMPALVQIMAWSRPSDKPLSEPAMVSLLTHICVTQPQWVNDINGLVQDFVLAMELQQSCAKSSIHIVYVPKPMKPGVKSRMKM